MFVTVNYYSFAEAVGISDYEASSAAFEDWKHYYTKDTSDCLTISEIFDSWMLERFPLFANEKDF